MFKNLNLDLLGVTASRSEVIELALSFGFKSIDLDMADFAAEVKSSGMARARRLFESAKLSFGSFELPIRPQMDDDAYRGELAKFSEWAVVARELGLNRCFVSIASACDLRPFHQNFEFHRSRITEIARHLEPFGVHVGLGFSAAADLRKGKEFEFIHDFDAFFALLSAVGAKNVGFSLDLWDLHASGGDVASVLTKLKPGQILSVRVADGPETTPPAEWTSDARYLPGETGVIDCASALKSLAQAGFAGPVTPAPDKSKLADKRRDAVVRAAGEKLERVWQAAGLAPPPKPAPVVRPAPAVGAPALAGRR